MEYNWFLNRSSWPIDEILIDTTTTTLGQRRTGSNDNEEVPHSQSQMLFITIPRTPPFMRGFYTSTKDLEGPANRVGI